ncbi:MAG: C-GCAxxG-C-C family protein [Lachnospiraceae bacterium]|nr:C-GCAxxG-C-C family protein [Lachnospiraceae bacterium]
MSERAEKALAYKRTGMNCAQSVALAFQDLTELDEQTLAAMTQTFGAGVGASMEGTCGAVMGAAVILGLVGKERSKPENMKRAKQLLMRFKDQNQSVICRELKGIDTGKVLRSCNDCVADAAGFLEEILKSDAEMQ